MNSIQRLSQLFADQALSEQGITILDVEVYLTLVETITAVDAMFNGEVPDPTKMVVTDPLACSLIAFLRDLCEQDKEFMKGETAIRIKIEGGAVSGKPGIQYPMSDDIPQNRTVH